MNSISIKEALIKYGLRDRGESIRFLKHLGLLLILLLLTACAPARNEPAAPDIRVSGSWEIGASKTKGF